MAIERYDLRSVIEPIIEALTAIADAKGDVTVQAKIAEAQEALRRIDPAPTIAAIVEDQEALREHR